jgi:hypothetical protein
MCILFDLESKLRLDVVRIELRGLFKRRAGILIAPDAYQLLSQKQVCLWELWEQAECLSRRFERTRLVLVRLQRLDREKAQLGVVWVLRGGVTKRGLGLPAMTAAQVGGTQ